jgi:hypothetical protein
MGRIYEPKYHEVRGFRLSDNSVTDMADIAKENYYALAICLITGWKPDYCLGKMGLLRDRKKYEYKQEPPYKKWANASYVLNVICGYSYKEVAKLLKISVSIARDGVYHIQGRRRVRTYEFKSRANPY